MLRMSTSRAYDFGRTDVICSSLWYGQSELDYLWSYGATSLCRKLVIWFFKICCTQEFSRRGMPQSCRIYYMGGAQTALILKRGCPRTKSELNRACVTTRGATASSQISQKRQLGVGSEPLLTDRCLVYFITAHQHKRLPAPHWNGPFLQSVQPARRVKHPSKLAFDPFGFPNCPLKAPTSTRAFCFCERVASSSKNSSFACQCCRHTLRWQISYPKHSFYLDDNWHPTVNRDLDWKGRFGLVRTIQKPHWSTVWADSSSDIRGKYVAEIPGAVKRVTLGESLVGLRHQQTKIGRDHCKRKTPVDWSA